MHYNVHAQVHSNICVSIYLHFRGAGVYTVCPEGCCPAVQAGGDLCHGGPFVSHQTKHHSSAYDSTNFCYVPQPFISSPNVALIAVLHQLFCSGWYRLLRAGGDTQTCTPTYTVCVQPFTYIDTLSRQHTRRARIHNNGSSLLLHTQRTVQCYFTACSPGSYREPWDENKPSLDPSKSDRQTSIRHFERGRDVHTLERGFSECVCLCLHSWNQFVTKCQF